METLWTEGFDDLSYEVLEAAFKKALKVSKFWPVKVADIREHVEHVKESATNEAAELAWQRVLELRRVYWNPDMPGGFSRGMPVLSPRIERAARAAGVFRDHETLEALHVWAKKKFIESFIRWDETGESQNLLPDGEIKRLLKDSAQAKALRAPTVDFHALHERGLEYCNALEHSKPELAPEERLEIADKLAEAARQIIERDRKTKGLISVSDEDRKALREQAEIVRRKYPTSEVKDEHLRRYILEPIQPIPQREADVLP